MASIRQRNGRWQAQVRRQGYAAVTQSFGTKAQAVRWARDQETKIENGVWVDPSELRKETVKSLFKRFLEEKVPLRKGQRWETVRIRFLSEADFAHRRLDQDISSGLRAWVETRGKEVSAETVVRDLNLISSIFGTAIKEWGVPLQGNPVATIKRPKVSTASKGAMWTPEALDKLRAKYAESLEKIGDRRAPGVPLAEDYVMPALELSIETAMRRGELCAFRVQDVFLEERRIWLPPEITKTDTGRNALLSTRAVAIVQELLNFPRPRGDDRVIPLNADTLGLRFRQLRKAAGVSNLRLHDGRHTATTRASKVFTNVLELAAFTGHTSLQTLKRYYHSDPTDMAKRLG
jgi:integrase